MSGAALGPPAGRGYVPGIGEGDLFATDRPDFLRLQTARGIRHWVPRTAVQFRKRRASA